MSKDDSQFRLRIPTDLKVRIEEAAKANNRSMNAQVLAMLDASLRDGDRIEEHDSQISDHEKRIADLERRMDDVFHMAGWRDYPENEK